MENYTIIQNINITDITLSDGAYRLYNLLQSLAYWNKTQIFPSEKYLAVSLGRSVHTIQRYLKQLVKASLISIRRRGSTSNLITLLQKRTKQAVEKVKDTVSKAKKAYNAFKSQNKKDKQSTFASSDERSYNFDALEKMALGYEQYDPYKALLEWQKKEKNLLKFVPWISSKNRSF